MGLFRLITADLLLLSCVRFCSGQAYGTSGPQGTYASYEFHPRQFLGYHADQAAGQQQGARHLLAYGGSRTLLQAAYSVQQFDAETIGLKYSQGDRRRLLDAPAPAYRAGAYETVTLPGGSPEPGQHAAHLPQDIGEAVTVLPTKGAYGGRLPGAYGSSHIGIPAITAYGRF